MKNLFCTLLILSFLIKGLTAQELLQKVYGEHGSNEDRGECIIATADGGSLVAGKAINPTTQFFDAFLLKLDANGEKMWYKTFESARNTEATNAIESNDGGFIFCGIAENSINKGTAATIWKVDKDGVFQWKHTVDEAPNEGFLQLVKLMNGNYLVAGYREATNLIDKSDSKIIWKRFDDTGQILLEDEHILAGNAKPIKAIEAPDASLRLFLAIKESYQNYVLNVSTTPSVRNIFAVNSGFLDEQTLSVELLADNAGKTYTFFLSKLSGLIITQYDSLNYTQNYYIPFLAFGATGTLTAEFIDKYSIYVTIFTHSNDQTTEIISFYIDLIQGQTILKSSFAIPLQSNNIRAIAPQGDTYFMLMNDTLSTDGEMDFSVVSITDSTQGYSLVWEQSFGYKAPNNNEILVKTCETKTGNQMVLAKRYQPDLQYFILLTDKEGNHLKDQNISLNFVIDAYQIVDMQPTPDNGAAILVRTTDELILWKISSDGTLESEKQIPVSISPIEFTSIIVRPDGYAFCNNTMNSGNVTVLFLFDKNLKITGYRKIKTLNTGGYINGGLSLKNGAIALIGITFNNTGFDYTSAIRIIITDKKGFPYQDKTIESGSVNFNANYLLKLVENGILLSTFDNYTSKPILFKINFSGDLLWTTVLNGVGNGLNAVNILLETKEIPCKGIVTGVGTKNLQANLLDAFFNTFSFQLTSHNGLSIAKSCVNLLPTFVPCAENVSFVSDFAFGTWSSRKTTDQSFDLVYERIIYPTNVPNFKPNKLNILNNPTSNGHLCLNISNEYQGDFTIEIWNAEGRLMTTLRENKNSELWEKTLEINELCSGIYFVKAKLGPDVLQAKWSTFFN
jgi:hypothetical protein